MAADQQRYDLILRNGLIVDGTGASAIKGDIAITNGKIVKCGELKDLQARYEKMFLVSWCVLDLLMFMRMTIVPYCPLPICCRN